jgi:hypothetical protein
MRVAVSTRIPSAVARVQKLTVVSFAWVIFWSHANLLGIELIENGSFEEGRLDGGLMLNSWSDAPSGVNNRGLAVSRYHPSSPQLFEYPPGIPTPPDFDAMIQPAGAGDYFGFRWGWGNGDGLSGSATQLIDVSRYTDLPFQFSAWLASRFGASDIDYAVVSLEFFTGPDGMGDSLGTVLFDGNDQESEYIVGSMSVEGLADPLIAATQDNWTFYRTAGTIPSFASSAAVVIRSAREGGVGVDAYVDLVSLQIVPEPATAAMFALGILGLAVLVRTTCYAARR